MARLACHLEAPLSRAHLIQFGRQLPYLRYAISQASEKVSSSYLSLFSLLTLYVPSLMSMLYTDLV